MNKSNPITGVAALIALLFWVGCEEKPKSAHPGADAKDYHTRIQVKEVRNSLLFKPVHGGSGNYNSLIIDGQEFKEVRGFAPYYIDLPEQKRIVFATGGYSGEGNALIHVYDFDQKRHLQFQTKYNGGGFGSGIGRTRKGEQDLVERATGDEIVLVNETLYANTMRKLVLDLKTERIRHCEWFVYDDKGKLTNSFIVNY